jgi:hypothetical protein
MCGSRSSRIRCHANEGAKMTSYRAEASDTMVWNAANAPLREPEPFCCSPGCPECDDVTGERDTCKKLMVDVTLVDAIDVSPVGRTHREAMAERAERHAEKDLFLRSHADTRRYESGVIRGDNTGKTDYTLALDGPLFERWARLLTENVESKGKRNWMNASTREDYDRFRESFLRHALSVLRGDTDEDHHAACVFNLNGMLYTQQQLGGDSA